MGSAVPGNSYTRNCSPVCRYMGAAGSGRGASSLAMPGRSGSCALASKEHSRATAVRKLVLIFISIVQETACDVDVAALVGMGHPWAVEPFAGPLDRRAEVDRVFQNHRIAELPAILAQ